jgi:Putative Ig domain
LQALLGRAQGTLHDRGDTSFADLVSWQNKASWLVGCGLFTILMLTIAIPHHSILFIVGAAGGLISRMTRSLDRKDVPTDYGASWTTLFLSPVSGALGAWAGILIADLAAQFQVLGQVFKADFSEPCVPTTLALAFVFGFSERLLDGVLDKLEEKSGVTTPRNPQPAQRTVPPTTQVAGGGAGLTITTQKLDDGKVNQPYTPQLQASGASGDVTWSVKEGSLPDGLQLTPSGPQAGSFTGTPTVANSFTFTVSATDGTSTKDQQLTIVINPS